MKKPQAKIYHSLTSIVLLIVVMLLSVVKLGLSPQIPLLFGCVVAGLVSLWAKYPWSSILEGMLTGISHSLEAILILLSIGVLIGVWIAGGVVPSMIYYGLKILSPKVFLPATMLICSVISMAVGSWGTAGTIGIALMCIGSALGAPPAITAGAIISGAYVGDRISPLTDITNLAAAVSKTNVFVMVGRMIKLVLIAFTISFVIYLVISLNSSLVTATAVPGDLLPIITGLESNFRISLFSLIPLVLMLACILLKVPALPSIMAGILSGFLLAIIHQNSPVQVLLEAAFSGYASNTGIQAIDELLSAGGLESMMYTISIIILAMAFGGTMQKTGQMAALMAPIVKKIKSVGAMTSLVTCTSIAMNIVLPDQYLSITVPGQMFIEEYDNRGIDRALLGNTLGSGGAVTSALVPWNSCGVYMSIVLGVPVLSYLPYSFLNLLMPVVMILSSVLTSNIKQVKNNH